MRLPYVRAAAPEVLVTGRAQRWDPAEVLRVLLVEEVTGPDAAAASSSVQQGEDEHDETDQPPPPSAIGPAPLRSETCDVSSSALDGITPVLLSLRRASRTVPAPFRRRPIRSPAS